MNYLRKYTCMYVYTYIKCRRTLLSLANYSTHFDIYLGGNGTQLKPVVVNFSLRCL